MLAPLNTPPFMITVFSLAVLPLPPYMLLYSLNVPPFMTTVFSLAVVPLPIESLFSNHAPPYMLYLNVPLSTITVFSLAVLALPPITVRLRMPLVMLIVFSLLHSSSEAECPPAKR